MYTLKKTARGQWFVLKGIYYVGFFDQEHEAQAFLNKLQAGLS